MRKTKKGIAVLLLVAILFSIGITSVFASEVTEPKVYKEGTNTLNLEGKFEADGNQGAILVMNGAQLNINGTDSTEVHAALGEKDFSMALWAHGADTKVVINGGYYTNETDGSERGTDLIYASGDATIEINGGKFKAAVEKWTLNCYDNSKSSIIVKGGTFYKFDPSNAEVGEGEIIVPEGYTVVNNGDWYTVYEAPKKYKEGMNTLNLEGRFEADGNQGAILVMNGAQLNINGTDSTEVHAALGEKDFSMALWAHGADTKVVINGGYYTNETDGSERGTDLIYASGDATIEINGGKFKAAVEKWTLNCYDNSKSSIIVKGGTFYKFDPSKAEVGDGEIIVPEGYRVIKDGDWYTVCEIKETEAEVSDKVADAEKVEEMVIETLKEAISADSELAKEVEGKSIEVEVEVKPVEVSKSEKETIETEATKKVEDIKVAEYIDISIVVKDADTDEQIAKLSTVKEAIKFTVEVPSKLKADIPEGYIRIFYIVRNHNGVIDVIEAKEADGKLSFESDKFSTYAIAYKDIKDESTITPPADEGDETTTPPTGNGDETTPPANEEQGTTTPPTEGGEGEAVPEPETQPEEKPEAKPETKPSTPDVPKTGDNIVLFVVIAIIAMAGIVIAIKVRKK